MLCRILLNEFYVRLFDICQDTMSLWDLHFLVVIHCWPDLAIHDFELITECGSASMVSYVSPFYTVAVHNRPNDVYLN